MAAEPAVPAPAPPTRPSSGSLSMCYACGQVLKGDEAKCPSCGAPTRTLRKTRRGGRLGLAGIVLVGFFIIIGFVAVGVLQAVSSGDLASTEAVTDQRASLSGTVTLENETNASQVRIFSSLNEQNATFSDANGSFELESLPVGFHKIRFERDNFTTYELRVLLLQDMTVQVNLAHGNSTETTTQSHGSYSSVMNFLNFCGALFVAIALLSLAGAIACFRRKNYLLALAGSIAALLGSLPFILLAFFNPISIAPVVGSIIATVIVVRNKSSFR